MNQPRIMPPLTSTVFSSEKKIEEAASPRMPVITPDTLGTANTRVSDEDAQKAVKLLLSWMGDDAEREGLKETPERVIRGWKEFFKGYKEEPRDHLKKTFANTEKYDDMVCLEQIRVESYCEHHLVPITGLAYIAYIPGERIVGLSKLARVLEGYAKRLQVQEKLTQQVASAIEDVLKPKGVAVAIRSEHQCLSTRGVHKPGSEMLTISTFGAFRNDPQKRAEFMDIVNRKGAALQS